MQKSSLFFFSVIAIFALPTIVSAKYGNYNGIEVGYAARSFAHFGNQWYSQGSIQTSEVVEQIGSTYWSTVEFCNTAYNYKSFYDFNGRIQEDDDADLYGFFVYRYGCSKGQTNRLRTYIRFYVQTFPWDGAEFPDTHKIKW